MVFYPYRHPNLCKEMIVFVLSVGLIGWLSFFNLGFGIWDLGLTKITKIYKLFSFDTNFAFENTDFFIIFFYL